jgi:hypothetical protein
MQPCRALDVVAIMEGKEKVEGGGGMRAERRKRLPAKYANDAKGEMDKSKSPRAGRGRRRDDFSGRRA